VVPRVPWSPSGAFGKGCCGLCVFAHELSHARDAEAANPGICQGRATDGLVVVAQGDPASRYGEFFRTEEKAWARQRDCLMALKKARSNNQACLSDIEGQLAWVNYVISKVTLGGTYPR
jgi:hypothetical protein